ncbi:MAG: hypothetical protein PVF47_05940 [Anaerolineae bacterium]
MERVKAMGEAENKAKETKIAYQAGNDVAAGELRGVQYLVDSAGKRTAVIINLEEWGDLWDEFANMLAEESREDIEEALPQEPPLTEEGDEIARAALKRMRGVIPITDPELARWLAESPELSLYGS